MFGIEPPDDDEDDAPDSERTLRADHEYDQQRDDALTDRLRELRQRLEADLDERDPGWRAEVPF